MSIDNGSPSIIKSDLGLPNHNYSPEFVQSLLDASIVCESSCLFNPDTKVVSNIAQAKNAADADNAHALTDEFVRLKDGTELRFEDGVAFIY
jgi:hypothetical protein